MKIPLLTGAVAAMILAPAAWAQQKGPSTTQSAYLLPTGPNAASMTTTSLLSAGDLVGSYKMVGIPDGLGAFDNGDGTFTLLMNHELGSGLGAVRAHGSNGAFVSKWVINKNTLQVVSGADLIQSIYPWDTATNASKTIPATTSINRLCSADLPPITAFFNATTNLGTTARIFMNGEEGGAGRAYASVATGPDAGKSYELGRFVATGNTNATENCLANPFAQDKTVVIGDNDGGSANVNNKLFIYVGTKTNTGSEADKAGLTNGVLKYIAIAGSPVEIVDPTSRATNIVSGTAFTLTTIDTSGTSFSRPEDGAWNPANPNQYYFVTTDRIDQVTDKIGAQIGRSRLWRLNFADIRNPDAGGTIDLLLDGTEGQNMLDNLTVATDGHLLLQEDVGGAPHNGKLWNYDPVADALTLIAKHDSARFGDIASSGAISVATAPFNNDEESSGVIDISAIMANSALSTGRAGEQWFMSSDQAHYTSGNGVDAETVEGGQMFLLHVSPIAATPAPTPAAPVALNVSGKDAIKTENKAVKIRGSAASADTIAKVEYRVGKGGLKKAKGTNSWNLEAKLNPGKNVITIRVTTVGGEVDTAIVRVTRTRK